MTSHVNVDYTRCENAFVLARILTAVRFPLFGMRAI